MNTDAGKNLLSEVTEWARHHSVPIVSGHTPSTLRGIRLEFDSDSGLGAQLCDRLEAMNPYLIVTEHSVLTSEIISQSLDALATRGAESSEVEATRACEEFVGQVSSAGFHIFIKDGPISLEYTFFAPWFDDAYHDEEARDPTVPHDAEEDARLKAEEQERENRNRAWQVEREKWTGAARTAAARRIAKDPRFSQAKTEAARVFLTRDILGAEVPNEEYLVKEISREAKAVFDFEVVPRK